MPDRVKIMPRSGDMAKELATSVRSCWHDHDDGRRAEPGEDQAPVAQRRLPSAENVERKIYTLTRDSYLVTKALPSPAVARFIEFIRSSVGTAVIVANGAVPVKSKIGPASSSSRQTARSGR